MASTASVRSIIRRHRDDAVRLEVDGGHDIGLDDQAVDRTVEPSDAGQVGADRGLGEDRLPQHGSSEDASEARIAHEPQRLRQDRVDVAGKRRFLGCLEEAQDPIRSGAGQQLERPVQESSASQGGIALILQGRLLARDYLCAAEIGGR